MALNEVIRTSGDIRRLLAQTMVEIKTGQITVDKGMAIAALSKELTSSLQVEVNVAKVRAAMLQGGHQMGRLSDMGKLIIEDSSTPTLSGASE